MKKKRRKAELFESVGTGKFINVYGNLESDTFANIYESMLQSEAFKTLKPRYKVLYMICKAQYYGKRKPRNDYPNIPELQGNDLFYLSKEDLVTKYGYASRNCDKELYGYMDSKTGKRVPGAFDILEEHGLIEFVSRNKASRQKNIYRFSDKWKDWKA